MVNSLQETTLGKLSDSRRQFLYSSLAPRKEINPIGFNSAIQWWKAFLVELVAQGRLGDDRLLLTASEEMREGLRWEGSGRPTSLGTIISELSDSKDIISLPLYLSTHSSTNSRMTPIMLMGILARPITWSFAQLRTSILDDPSIGAGAEEALWESKKGKYVIMELVKKSANTILPQLNALHIDPISRLYTIKSFHQTVISLDPTLSGWDSLVLAHHFSSDRSLCAFHDEVIKFSSSSSTPAVITPSDIGILSLISTLATLSSQITSLTSQITLERSKMLQANSAKQLSLVKSHLIRRKQLESVLEKRISSKDRIGEVLYAIEKAVGDEEIMKALELGTSTLRLLISSPTLSLDHIEETTTALEDALADSKEINEAINEGALDKGAEEAVEAELEELIRAEREEEEEKLAKQSEEKEKEIEKLMEKLNIDQAPITTLPSSTTSEVEQSGVAQVDEAVENLTEKVLVTDH